MGEKIRTSELFARMWQLFAGRYRELLTPILMVMLPYSILSGAMSIAMTQMNSYLFSSYYGANPMDMFAQSAVLAGGSIMNMLVSILLVIPTGYAMCIILLFPGVKGMSGIRHAFSRYGKALGNVLFSYLPLLIAMIPLMICLTIAMFPISFILISTGTYSLPAIIVWVVILILLTYFAVSVVCAYTAQMLPLSIKENVPITKTFSLAVKRAKGTVFSYIAVMLLYYLIIIVPTVCITVLQQYSMEAYYALFSVTMIGSAFISPFVYALNAAVYQLRRERMDREEQLIIGEPNDLS